MKARTINGFHKEKKKKAKRIVQSSLHISKQHLYIQCVPRKNMQQICLSQPTKATVVTTKDMFDPCRVVAKGCGLGLWLRVVA
jgi:hypothetical protein